MVDVAILKAFTLLLGMVVVAVPVNDTRAVVPEKMRLAERVASPVTFRVEENVPVVPEMPPLAVRVEAVIPPLVMVRPPDCMVAPLVMTILSRVSTFWV